MILANASDLGRQYAGDPIFLGMRFEIRAGRRIGLVGPNGAGKTTLMKLLAGTDEPDYGHLHVRPGVRVGLLKQEPDFGADATLIEVARSGLATLMELQGELEEAAQELSEAEDDDDRRRASARYEQLRDRMEHQDAYSIEHRVEEVLGGLGFATGDFGRRAGTFSGGQQSRLMLAKLLLQAPDLMLLDEPSNHLDIETTEWLESYLSRQPVAMVIVSHDRYFLDRTVEAIWELYEGKLEVYPGNYSQYWKLRGERAKVLDRQAEKQKAEVADLEGYIRRYGAGQRAKQAKDREKKLARVESERVETMREIVGPVMGFGEVDRVGDVAIEARALTKGYDRPLFSGLDLQVRRGQRVGILGPNGAGKSTLLKCLIGREKADAGEVKIGHKVLIGYYDQGLESLPPETTVVRAVWPEDDPEWVEQDGRSLLARFGLPGDLAMQPVGKLSGGEKGKAALARLAATGANVLVLDEPTNHLDLWSCEALERSLREYEGTVLVVSHDRYFLNAVAQRLIVVSGGRALVVEGDYETYQRLAKQKADAEAARTRAVATAQQAAAPAAAPRKRRKFPYRKAAELEVEIGERERELAEAEAELSRPETYRDAERARAARQRFDDLKAAVAALYEHWEEASEYRA